MKKKRRIDAGLTCILTKTMRIMRLSVFFTFLFIAQTWATPIYSQQTRLSLSMKNVRVMDVLNEIEKSSEFFFFFNEKLVNVDRKVDLIVKDGKIEEILHDLFESTDVNYKVIDKQIILTTLRGRSEELQQNVRNVTGKVTDRSGLPLPGVTVIVKGTTKGVTTDNDGSFSLLLPIESKILVFSFVGMRTREVIVENQTIINVVLEEETIGLEEVVAVGYGTKIRRDVTGSITAVKSKDIQNFKASSVDALLQGQGAGIQVSQSNGTPGSPVRVMIRGTHSIYADAEPLWVVDGIPISNPANGIAGGLRGTAGQNYLATINPSDIESIEVLKDAAATSIYGSRGSNGVILVTTKSGKKGQGYVTLDASFGVTDFTRNANDIGFTNGAEWLDLVEKGRSNYGLATIKNDKDLNNLISQKTSGQLFNVDRISNTNWFDEITRKGAYKEYNLSISRGYEKGTIFSSINYRDEKGVLLGNDFKRITGRINADFEPINNLKAGVKVNLGYSDNNQVMNAGVPSGNDVLAAGGFNMAVTGSLPIFPKWWDESKGTYFMPASGYNVAASNNINNFRFQLETYRAIGGIYLDYTLPWIKGLSVRTEWSADINSDIRNFMVKKLLRPKNTSYGEYQPRMQRNLNYNVYANYNRTFNEVHNVSATLGTESQLFTTRDIIVFGENFPEENRQFGTQDAARIPSGGFGGERYIRSYFARANYRLKDRYIVSGSIRRDGVSIFTPENRWSTFASGSFGWIFSEEKFMKNLSFVNLAKLRLSYGQTGNQGVPQVTSPGWATWPVYGNTGQAASMSTIGVTSLTWETTNSYDAGLDFGLFKNRISGSVGYYRQEVDGLLFQVPIPYSSGLPFGAHKIWSNIGKMRNDGLEFNITASVINKGEFKWVTSLNISSNANKLLSINENMDSKGQGILSGMTWNKKGNKLSSFFMAEYAGVDKEKGIPMIYEIDRDRYLKTNETVKTGNLIPATTANVNNHKILQEDKTGLPTYFGGFTNAFSWKGFELSAMLTFQGGNYIYDQAEQTSINMGKGGTNLRKDLIGNTWTKAGDNAKYPQIMWDYSYQYGNDGLPVTSKVAYSPVTTQFLYKGDFIRLRTIQLSYTIPTIIIQKAGIKNLRVFVSGNNLLTITGFKGWDPEFSNVSSSSEARNLQQGVAGNSVPSLKVWNAGFNITF